MEEEKGRDEKNRIGNQRGRERKVGSWKERRELRGECGGGRKRKRREGKGEDGE